MQKDKMIAEINDKPALVSDLYSISYEQFYEKIASFARHLGKPKEELKIAIFSENRPEWVYALYAIWSRNCIAMPLDYLSSSDELEYMLSDASPGVVFCSAGRKSSLEEIQEKVDFSFRILVFEEMENDRNADSEKPQLWIEDKNKPALILYTSGTTGNPKGVMLSFKNLLFNIDAMSQKVKIMEPHDRIFMLLPLHHIFPLMGTVVIPFYLGCTVVVAPSLVAEEFTKTMQKFKPTLLIGVPRLYESMHNRISAKIKSNAFTKMIFKLARASRSKVVSGFVFKTVHKRLGGAIKYMISGGARLDPVIFNDFRTLGFEVLEGYGLTETAPMITFNHPGKSRAGSPGQPVPGLQTQIRENELVVKGDNVMLGYLNLEKETSEKIKDGWFHTGDLGYFDDKNYLYLTGRKNEMIVLPNGKNINPLEIEDKIVRLDPGVKEVAVFMHENILQALIHPDFEQIKEQGKDKLLHHFKQNVFDKLNEMLSNHKRIMKFHLSKSELPKTRLGKVKRFELAGMLEQNREEKPRQKEPQLREYRMIKKFIEDETGREVYPEDHIEFDLAIDSLGKVSLSSYISSTFGVEVAEENLTKYESVTELAEYIHQHKTQITDDQLNWADILKTTKKVHVPSSWPTIVFFTGLSRLLFALLYKVKNHGKHNLPDGPFILAPNHESFLDGFLVISQLPRKYRNQVYSYATVQYFKQKWWRKFATRNNIIVMDIRKNLKLSMKKLAEALKLGKNLMIFPEGERSVSGNLLEFKQTFAILSRELNVPVVPVALQGPYEAYPPGHSFPSFFKTLEVHFLPPVYPENKNYEEIKSQVHSSIRNSLG